MFAGDNGMTIVYSTGGNAYMAASDPNFKQVFALITAARLSEKVVIIRLGGASSCTEGGQTLIGVWL
jgi:hypothetical protein